MRRHVFKQVLDSLITDVGATKELPGIFRVRTAQPR